MENNNNRLIIANSPHIVSYTDTSKIMLMVILALLPAFAVGVYEFGVRALILTVVCVASCAVFEGLWNKLMKKPQTVGDYSACLTGLILAMNVPASLPYWIAIIGCFFSIIIVKQLFGGLGQNFANPAVTGRIFLFISFATEMTTWPTAKSSGIDAVTSATPLAHFASGGIDAVREAGFSNMDLFLGACGGSIGEVSALAILIGGLFLIWKEVISPIIPAVFIATVFVCGLIQGGFDGALFHIFAGGVMFGAFFCATDYVTSPTMASGKVIYAIGCGLLTMLIRLFASYPEGVSFAILLMNILTPHIENFVQGRAFPAPKKAKKGGNEDGK